MAMIRCPGCNDVYEIGDPSWMFVKCKHCGCCYIPREASDDFSVYNQIVRPLQKHKK